MGRTSAAAKSDVAPSMFLAPVNRLRTSPTQPRKIFRAMEELTASVREVGVLQSLLVRTWPGTTSGDLEVVAGERRHRAAKAAGITTVPVILRELTDDQVREAQLIENNGREDVHPLEEASAFSNYLDAGHDVAELATKLGRSESYVRARLRLLDLSDRARAALEKETLTFSAALVLATAARERQDEILDDFSVEADGAIAKWADTGSIGRRDVAQRFEDTGTDLGRAGWSKDDAELVPEAGPCSRCPKRTGAQAELFGEERDYCLDEACFGSKKEAHAKRLLEQANERGLPVLSGREAAGLLYDDGAARYGSSVVPLDEEVESGDEPADDEGDPATMPLRKLLEEAEVELPITLVQTSDGTVVETVKKADAAKALKSIRPEVAKSWQNEARSSPRSTSSAATSVSEEERRRARKWKTESEARRRIIAALVDAIAKNGLDDDAVRALVLLAIENGWSEALNAIIKRRRWPEAKARAGSFTNAREETVIRESRELDGKALLGLFVELVVQQSLSRKGQWHSGDVFGAKEPLGTLVENYTINVAHHRSEAKKALEPKSKLKKPPTKKAAPTKNSKKKAAKKKAKAKR